MTTDYDLDLDNLPNTTELIRPQVELARAMQEMRNNAIKSLVEPMSRFSNELNKSFLKSLTFSTMPSFLQDYPFLGVTHTASVTGQEVEERPTSEVPVLPIPDIRTRNKTSLGIMMIAGGSFKYRRKTLKNVSMDSNHGKLLALILTGKDHFVSDNTIYEKLPIYDGRDFGWILRNLKRAFRKNDLLITIERRKSPLKGYILIDILYLH